jgi:hypothetical protein
MNKLQHSVGCHSVMPYYLVRLFHQIVAEYGVILFFLGKKVNKITLFLFPADGFSLIRDDFSVLDHILVPNRY